MTITMTNLNTGIIPASTLIAGLAAATEGTIEVFQGDITATGTTDGVIQTSIAPGVVSYAKMQNESALSLLGNAAASVRSPAEIALGFGLNFSNNTILLDVSCFRNMLYGLNTNRNSITPTTTIDVTPGSCADSTNTSLIKISSTITKSTATFIAGTNHGGLGTGLTVANSTWYHIFAAIINGSVDVFFDTSVTAFNKPAGTTAFRRIGSFKTNASAQILSYSQNGDEFLWTAVVADASNFTIGASILTFVLTVPPGVIVNALGLVSLAVTISTTYAVLFYSPSTSGGSYSIQANALGEIDGCWFNIKTNTSQSIFAAGNASNGVANIITHGWIDSRGKNL